MPRKTVFQSFLQKNSIDPRNYLPLVHSTDAYLLKRSLIEKKLSTRPCDTFTGESLLYFFVGRPAYKKETPEEAAYWELPSCILFDFDVKEAKRIYPFDTGAFSRKLYPSYINMMNVDDFLITPSSENVKRAIGAFFGSTRDYYRLSCMDDGLFKSKHNVNVTDEEVLALHRLIKDRSKKFDDRRFSIETQFDTEFLFANKMPIYAIFPEQYLESKLFKSMKREYGTTLETYPFYPLRKEYYYYAIYEKIEAFYRKNGFYEI
jgi:hypothetical protein